MHWIVWLLGLIYLVGFIANTHIYYNEYMRELREIPCGLNEGSDRMALYGKYIFADALVFTMFALRYAVTICASLYLLTSSDWTYVLGRDAYARLGKIASCGRWRGRRSDDGASSPPMKEKNKTMADAGTKTVVGTDPLAVNIDGDDVAEAQHRRQHRRNRVAESRVHRRRRLHQSLREHLLPLISCQSTINLFVAYVIHSLFRSSNDCADDCDAGECGDGVIAHAGVAAAATTDYLIRALVLFASVHVVYAIHWFMSNASTRRWRVTGATRSHRRRALKLFDRCAVGHWDRYVFAPILCVVWLVCVDCTGMTAALPSAAISVVAPIVVSLLYAVLFRTRTVALRARYRRDSSAISVEFEMNDGGDDASETSRVAAQYMYVSIVGAEGGVTVMDFLRSWTRWYRCVSSSVSMSQRTASIESADSTVVAVDIADTATTTTYWQYLFENCACRDIAERYYRVADPQRRLSRFRDTANSHCSSIDSRCIEIPAVRIRAFGPFYAQVHRWNYGDVDDERDDSTVVEATDDDADNAEYRDDGRSEGLYETIDELAGSSVRPRTDVVVTADDVSSARSSSATAGVAAINICVDGGFFTLADNETIATRRRAGVSDATVRTFWYVSHTSYLRAAKSLSLRSPVIARLFANTDVVNMPDGTFELRRHIVKREKKSAAHGGPSPGHPPVALSSLARWHPEITTVEATSPSIVDATTGPTTTGETTTTEIWYANEFARGDDHRRQQQQPAYDSVPPPRPVAPLRSPLTVPLTRRSPTQRSDLRLFENPAYGREEKKEPTTLLPVTMASTKPPTSISPSSSYRPTMSIHRTNAGSIDVMRPMVRELSNARIASVSVYAPSKASYDCVPLYMATVFDTVECYSEYRCTG